MIPKIIHYCWLSKDPYPEKIKKCIESWHKYLPDYQFVLWNFDRFPRGKSPWVDEAFDNKKYAFAADFIRLYALYNYGGIYLDTDVEILKSFNDLLELPYILCWENGSKNDAFEMAALGCQRGTKWVEILLRKYQNRHFVNIDGSFETLPIPNFTYNVLIDEGYHFVTANSISEYKERINDSTDDMIILSSQYFSPKSYETGKISLTNKTICIHHYSGSWLPWQKRVKLMIKHFLGKKTVDFFRFIRKRI